MIRLIPLLFVLIFTPLSLKGEEGPSCQSKEAGSLSSQERYPSLLIFVSSSMPLQSLKDYASSIKGLHATLVLRGLVGGDFKQTQKLMTQIGGDIMIDPTLYRNYGITKVPSFVLSQDHETMKNADLIIGHLTLEAALEKFAQSGENQSLARSLLQSLRRGTHP